ncbi:MAG: hypothetical protein Q8J88_00560 [Bacteroidales bacterium]|nr:hypothetical protein [Bacteroidales bacterium]
MKKMKSKLFYTLSAVNLLTFCLYLFSFITKDDDKSDLNFSHKILKVRGIVVVDSLGIERVIVGSHLPEPNFSTGNRIEARGKIGSVSGVMLYDAEGQERGGYVTDDYYGNAFLTLDSKTSQHFLLIAEPQGSTSLQLWSRNEKNKINLFTDDNDAGIEFKKNGSLTKLYNDEK